MKVESWLRKHWFVSRRCHQWCWATNNSGIRIADGEFMRSNGSGRRSDPPVQRPSLLILLFLWVLLVVKLVVEKMPRNRKNWIEKITKQKQKNKMKNNSVEFMRHIVFSLAIVHGLVASMNWHAIIIVGAIFRTNSVWHVVAPPSSNSRWTTCGDGLRWALVLQKR